MALKLSTVNRWCATGTPIQKGMEGMFIVIPCRLSVCLSGSHTFLVVTLTLVTKLCFAGDTCIPWNAAILVIFSPFNIISSISQFGSRRYPIYEIKVVRPGLELQTPCLTSQELKSTTPLLPNDLFRPSLTLLHDFFSNVQYICQYDRQNVLSINYIVILIFVKLECVLNHALYTVKQRKKLNHSFVQSWS